MRVIGLLVVPIFFMTPVAAAPPPVQAALDTAFYDDGLPSRARVDLGRMLFFDKILSGNLNISCASCHHPLAGTGDGLSLSVGEGGRGLGVTRDTGYGSAYIRGRVPRNAPPLFNLGAREFVSMFLDGRVEADPSSPSGFRTPAGDELPDGLDNVLAAQAMFPVASATEMAGQAGENEQADQAALNLLAGDGGVWDLIAEKLRVIPDYLTLFVAAFPDEIAVAEDITFVHASNAIAAFEASAFRSDNSPFDRFLKGELRALSREALVGMGLFYGKARCGSCHSGTFQTDQSFKSVGIPQLGPGMGNSQDGYDDGRDDFGRERVTGMVLDRFRFRTPSLRNLDLTAPYGHSGAYDTLEAVVRHYIDPGDALGHYDIEQAVLPSRPDLDAVDFSVQNDPHRLEAIAESIQALPIELGPREMQALVSFLRALTDPAALDMRALVPQSVPSGLPVWD